MSWEPRPGGRYYTRTRRVAGRVVREYLGTGAGAVEAAAADEARRRQLQADVAARRALDAAIRELDQLVDLFVRAAMLAAGYHRPNRGPWRKRRVHKSPGRQSPRPD